MPVPALSERPEFRELPAFRMPDKLTPLHVANFVLRARRLAHEWREDVSVSRHLARADDGAAIPILEISPKKADPANRTLLYFHGGAFCITYDRRHLQKAALYASATGARVFFIDYRLSLTHPFPVPFDDCYSAALWVHRHALRLRVNRDLIIAMGDSAGGALAAGVVQKITDEKVFRPLGQCLIYPVIDADCKTESARTFVDAVLWNSHNNKRMWDIYLADARGENFPEYASPIHHPDLSRLPPAYIEAAALDPLKDEALDYAQALEAANVPVDLNFIEDAVHGFDFARFCAPIKKAHEARVAFLNRLFDAAPVA